MRSEAQKRSAASEPMLSASGRGPPRRRFLVQTPGAARGESRRDGDERLVSGAPVVAPLQVITADRPRTVTCSVALGSRARLANGRHQRPCNQSPKVVDAFLGAVPPQSCFTSTDGHGCAGVGPVGR